MPTQTLPPIPTPPNQLWREFRISFLPLIIFTATLIGVLLLWRQYVVPISVLGLVQTNSVQIVTTQAGLVSNLTVRQFDWVTNGQPLASVVVFDPEVTHAALIKAVSDSQIFGERMDINIDGRRQTIATLAVNLLAAKTLLNQDKVNLSLAESNLLRNGELFKSNIISQATLDAFRAARDGAKGQVQDRANMIKEFADMLSQLKPSVEASAVGMSNVIRQDILSAQDLIRQTQKPLVLTSPMNGRISRIFHHSGERVQAGASLITVTPTNSDLIVAYLRQPIVHYPYVGQKVIVRTRSPQRRTGDATIRHVGAQLENINAMFIPWATKTTEMGLPFAVSLPTDLQLMPGELVDVTLPRPHEGRD